MAAARFLNVLSGSDTGGTAAALRPAAAIGLHTAAVTVLSRFEVSGAPVAVPAATLASMATIAIGTYASAPPRTRTATGACAALYLLACAGPLVAAARNPAALPVRRAVAAGIRAFPALQAALTARAGSPVAAAFVASALPLTRWLGRRVSPT
jgi:4-hydroxybenzoate polyprenyltransferase